MKATTFVVPIIRRSPRAADARSGRRPRVAIACTGVLVWADLFAAPTHADPATLSCGSVVPTKTTLGQDLSYCAGDGRVVGADNSTRQPQPAHRHHVEPRPQQAGNALRRSFRWCTNRRQHRDQQRINALPGSIDGGANRAHGKR